MNPRERNLAIVVLGLLFLLGVVFLANIFFLRPKRELQNQITTKEKEIAKKRSELAAAEKYIKKVEDHSPRLSLWEKLSLPDGDRKTGAFERHLTYLRNEYQRYLIDLLRGNGFKNPSVNALRTDRKAAPTFPNTKTPIYDVLAFTVEGETSLASVAQVFEGLYNTPLLHQIKTFNIDRQGTSRDLKVKMTIEVLLVHGAEPLAKRKSILHKDLPSMVLAADPKRYRSISSKDIFHPPQRTVSQTTPEVPTEDKEDVLQQVTLEFTSPHSRYYNCAVAVMRNRGNKNDIVWVVDKELPAESPYQAEKKAVDASDKKKEILADEMMRKKLEPPIRVWSIKDIYGQEVLKMEVIKIHLEQIVVHVEENLYSLSPGDNLLDALTSPLEESDLQRLGLSEDKESLMKNIKLTKLEENKDRLDNGKYGWEAVLENTASKEQKILAVIPKQEEFVADDTWAIKDKFRAEVVKFTALRIGKEQMIIKAEDKFYVWLKDATLFEVMKKPLSEDEVKKLGLK